MVTRTRKMKKETSARMKSSAEERRCPNCHRANVLGKVIREVGVISGDVVLRRKCRSCGCAVVSNSDGGDPMAVTQ